MSSGSYTAADHVEALEHSTAQRSLSRLRFKPTSVMWHSGLVEIELQVHRLKLASRTGGAALWVAQRADACPTCFMTSEKKAIFYVLPKKAFIICHALSPQSTP